MTIRFLAISFLCSLLGLAQEPTLEKAPAPADAQSTERAAQARARIRHLPNGDVEVGKLHLHRKERCISFPVEFVENVTVLEVVVATPEGRLHEALLSADVSPLQLQAMLYLLGLENGARIGDKNVRQGDLVDLDVEWTGADGVPHREPMEDWITDSRTKLPMKRIGWVFVGSGIKNGSFLADAEGNICLCYSIGSTILDIPDPAGADDTVFTLNEHKKLPPKTAKVRLILSPRPKAKGGK
jgi:hypothetical protein